MRIDLESLNQSPLLAPFAVLLATSFGASYRQPYIAPDFPRLENNEQVARELRPGAIIFLLMSVDDPTTALASVAMHPYRAPPPEELKALPDIAIQWMVQPSENDPQMPRWVLKQLCVAPQAQRNGLAGWLLDLTDNVLRQIVTQQKADPNVPEVTEECDGAKLVLSTAKEINGEFYEKRNWITTAEKRMVPGFMGSEGGFVVVLMERNVLL